MMIGEKQAREIGERYLHDNGSPCVIYEARWFNTGWLLCLSYQADKVPGASSVAVFDDGHTENVGSAGPGMLVQILNQR
jgi:hypothetical protein